MAEDQNPITIFFQNISKVNNIQHYSRFADKGPSLAAMVTRTRRIVLKKLGFVTGNCDWLSEFPFTIKIQQYNLKFNNNEPHSSFQDDK